MGSSSIASENFTLHSHELRTLISENVTQQDSHGFVELLLREELVALRLECLSHSVVILECDENANFCSAKL